jgi:hypothetical protein
MKLTDLIRLSVLAIATSTTIVSLTASKGFANPAIAPVHPSVQLAQSQSTALASGTFVAAEKPTIGTARIVVGDDGTRYLELSPNFSTSNQGPDLHVLLDPSSTPPRTYSPQQTGRYITLGGLRSYTGAQRYPIPNSVNLSNFQSVVIWCRMANATFGYAPLRAASTATAAPATTGESVRGLW